MTRILAWNINNFSQPKIANTAVGNSRLAHIVNEVFMPQVPDIFVVIEVFARTRDVGMEGVPIVGGARQGAIQLLGDIQNATGNNNWMLVPPVWSGSFGFGEGIAVYYDSGNLQFVGPYVYGPDYTTATRTPPIERACPLANTVRPVGRPPAWLNGPQLYPNAWAGCLPNRVSPAALGLPRENRLAGKYEFFVGGARINFPTPFNRSPFQTNFIDRTMAPPRRTIKVFSVHTSPGFARAGVQRLSTVPDIIPAPGEVSVMLGDFNVDTFDSRAAYNVLTGANFTIAFDSINAGAVRATRMPYCLTHLLPTRHATPYGTTGVAAADPQHNVYPRFGYMGSMGGFLFRTPVDAGAIDNFFTQYGGGVAGGPATNASIVNTVVGKPYNVAPAPANVTAALRGGLAYAQRLNTAIPLPAGRNSTVGTAAAALATFQQWNNFDRIHSTSDHLPLVINV